MNTLNRIAVVILLLVLMVVFTVTLILPYDILTNLGGWLQIGGEYVDQLPQWLRIVGGLFLAIIVDAILALLIFFEVRPKRKRFIRVQQVAGGMVTINDTSIIQQLEYKLDPVPGVINVSPEISAKGEKVRAKVNVEVSAGANVPQMAAHLMDVVQTVLAEDLGLQVYGQPEVRIKVSPAPPGAHPQPVPPPQPPASSSPPPLPASEAREERRRKPEAEAKEDQGA